jgi:alanine racemase
MDSGAAPIPGARCWLRGNARHWWAGSVWINPQLMISHIPDVRQGDEVVLIGRQGNELITAEEVAKNLGTINYEVVSELLARIPRVS